MAKDTAKARAKEKPTAVTFRFEPPKLPADFRGAQYGNLITVSASTQEVFLDLFQLGPEAGGHSEEGKAIFVGRFIFPLAIAKELISELQSLVESIEKDKGIKLPGPEEVSL